jgi:two-component system nitrogen regulation response regulator GlnG
MQDSTVNWIHNRFKTDDNQNIYAHLMDHFSMQIVNEALAMANGNRTRAAKLLGISRQALIAKIANYSS